MLFLCLPHTVGQKIQEKCIYIGYVGSTINVHRSYTTPWQSEEKIGIRKKNLVCIEEKEAK